jgi:2-hydroxy-3-oxopropionate reductase
MSTKIGVIGLGVMGAPIARNLSRQFDVIACDRDPSRKEQIPGVTFVASPSDVATEVDLLFLSLPNTAVVSSVVEGENGLIDHMKAGSVLIDLSTTEPEATRRMAEKLTAAQIEMIDAPVSGGEAGAIGASLSIMCGGSPATFDRCVPYLSAIGSSVVHVGDHGAGQVAKLANNMIVGAAFVAAAEAFALASTAGITPDALHEALRGGWAGSPVFEVTAQALRKKDFTPGGTVDLLSKDLGYARSLARSELVPIPVTSMVDEVFTAARARGDGAYSQPVIIQLWEAVTGRKISNDR